MAKRKQQATFPKQLYVYWESDYLIANATTEEIDEDRVVGVYEFRDVKRVIVERRLEEK